MSARRPAEDEEPCAGDDPVADAGFEFVDAVTSDLCFRAWGASREAVFRAASDALLAATVEAPERVGGDEVRRVQLEEPDLELLLLRFLNELVYLRDAEQLLLRVRELRLRGDGPVQLDAQLAGERIDPARHRLLTDVKAATAHGLRVARAGEPDGPARGWEARATLDV